MGAISSILMYLVIWLRYRGTYMQEVVPVHAIHLKGFRYRTISFSTLLPLHNDKGNKLTISVGFLPVSRIRIRDPVPFLPWIRDPE
jgi:hypothetical protein